MSIILYVYTAIPVITTTQQYYTIWLCTYYTSLMYEYVIICTYLVSILVDLSVPRRSCICREELISLLSNILHHLKGQNVTVEQYQNWNYHIIFMIGCHILHAVPLLAMVVHINVASRLLVVSASTYIHTYIRRRDWQKNKRNGVLDISALTDCVYIYETC